MIVDFNLWGNDDAPPGISPLLSGGEALLDFNGCGLQGDTSAARAEGTGIDLQTAAQMACGSAGLIYAAFPADGRVYRLDVEDKAKRNQAGSIKLFADGEGGWVENHVDGELLYFWAKSDQVLNPAEKEARKKRRDEESRRAALELAEERAKAAKLALDVLKASQPPEGNPYLARKQEEPTYTLQQISLENLKKIIGYYPQAKGEKLAGKNILIVPVGNGEDITTIEMIDEAGRKCGLKGGEKRASFWSTCNLPDGSGIGLTFGLGEGVVTVLTCRRAIGCIGIAALSCGNLKAVAQYFRGRYPAAKIIIFSDLGNGEKDAAEAARIVGGALAVPTFPCTRGPKDTDFNDLAQLAGGIEAVRLQLAVYQDANVKPSLFMSIEELLSRSIKPDFLIDGVIERDTIGIVVGASQSGKTFVVLDWALSVATGRPWNGRQVKQGLVDYVCGEGAPGIPRRVQAWLNHNKITMSEAANFRPSRNPITFDAQGIADVEAELRTMEAPPALLIIDTLAKAIPDDADENSNNDMSKFLKQTDRLRGVFPGCTIVIVHHTGHAEGARSRGASSLRGDVSFEILVNKTGTIEFNKLKDAEKPSPIEFKLVSVVVDHDDEKDKPITSCVPVYGERSEANIGGLTTEMEHVAIKALIVASVQTPIQQKQTDKWGALITDWREVFYEIRKMSEPDMKQGTLLTSFKRACSGLSSKGTVAEDGILRVLTGHAHQGEILDRLAMPHTAHAPHIAAHCTGAIPHTHVHTPMECTDVRGPVRAEGQKPTNLPEWGRS